MAFYKNFKLLNRLIKMDIESINSIDSIKSIWLQAVNFDNIDLIEWLRPTFKKQNLTKNINHFGVIQGIS